MIKIPARLLFKGVRILSQRSSGGVPGWRWSGRVVDLAKCRRTGDVLVTLSVNSERQTLRLDPYDQVEWLNPKRALAESVLDRIFYFEPSPEGGGRILTALELAAQPERRAAQEVALIEVVDERLVPDDQKVEEIAYTVSAVQRIGIGWRVESSTERQTLRSPWNWEPIYGRLQLGVKRKIGHLS